jgi:hypothetical protein
VSYIHQYQELKRRATVRNEMEHKDARNNLFTGKGGQEKEKSRKNKKGKEKGRRTRRSPKGFVLLFIVMVNVKTEQRAHIPMNLYPQEDPMIRPGRVHAMVPRGRPAQKKGHGALHHPVTVLVVEARVKGNLADSG